MCHLSVRAQEVSNCFCHFMSYHQDLLVQYAVLKWSGQKEQEARFYKFISLYVYLEKKEDNIDINLLPLEYTLEFMEYFITSP